MPTLFLIRHAHAGSRRAWRGDDVERPLSEKGARQAAGIAELLGGLAVGRVLSSPAVRCRQTVEPLADRLDLRVEDRPELREGADPTKAIRLLEELTEKRAALCTHGDVMPEVVQLLARRGMDIEGPTGNDKGSWWEITRKGDRFLTARWHPPA